LLSQIAEGDQRAFTMLFDFYYQSLGTYIYKVTESREATEEIVQEVFIKIWERRSTLGSINNFKGYLFILSKNKTLDHLRKAAETRTSHLSLINNSTEGSYVIDSIPSIEEYSLIIEEVVSKLPAQQQRVYHLSRHEKLKYDEIAFQMGISKETVKKHMQLALSFLKQQVKMQIQHMNLGLLFVALIYF